MILFLTSDPLHVMGKEDSTLKAFHSREMKIGGKLQVLSIQRWVNFTGPTTNPLQAGTFVQVVYYTRRFLIKARKDDQ